MKLISQDQFEAIRKDPNQSQPVSGRKTSGNDDNDETNETFQSQANKGNSLKIDRLKIKHNLHRK